MRALIGVLLLIGIAVAFVSGNDEGEATPTDRPVQDDDEPNARITGEFLRWEPVDEENGYAYFSITNHGPEDGVAECTIEVRNDFGDFGFDILVGESIEAGETIRSRIPIDVGEGSFLINEGEVTDC